MNIAYKAKQAWRAIANLEAPRVRILKAKYHPLVDFFRENKQRICS